jgi:hypothetical protein
MLTRQKENPYLLSSRTLAGATIHYLIFGLTNSIIAWKMNRIVGVDILYIVASNNIDRSVPACSEHIFHWTTFQY